MCLQTQLLIIPEARSQLAACLLRSQRTCNSSSPLPGSPSRMSQLEITLATKSPSVTTQDDRPRQMLIPDRSSATTLTANPSPAWFRFPSFLQLQTAGSSNLSDLTARSLWRAAKWSESTIRKVFTALSTTLSLHSRPMTKTQVSVVSCLCCFRGSPERGLTQLLSSFQRIPNVCSAICYGCQMPVGQPPRCQLQG